MAKVKSRTIAIGCAVLLAVVVVWWLRHGGDKPAAPTAAGHEPASAVERPQPREERGEPGALAIRTDDDDPRGTLRLEGIVLGPDDQPVGGAVVTLDAHPPRSVTTEGDGGFVFDALVGRTYTLVARASRGTAGPVTLLVTAKTEPVTLRLRAGGSLSVDVVGTDGKPIDGATVELRGVDTQTAQSAAGHATFVAVVPGVYDVVGWASGKARAHQQVRVRGATTARLVLFAGAGASGKVVDDGNAPVAGARVAYVASGDFRGPGQAPLEIVTTGADGAWRFAALPAGSFRFAASDDTHAPGVSGLVTLDGASERSGIVVTLGAGATLRGRVVDNAKQPVAGARVQIGPGRGGGRRGGPRQAPRQAYSDAQGELTIRGLPRAVLVATATHESGASSGVEVDMSSGSAEVTLVLDLTAIIAGTVVDGTGQPVEGAQVTAFASGGNGNGFGRPGAAVTDAGGAFRIAGLATGSYTVRASRGAMERGFGGRGRRADGVEAKTGDEHVKIVLPAEGGVKGTVAFADGSAPAVIAVRVGAISQSFVGGAFELDSIAPGDETLTVTGPGFTAHEQSIAIESGKTLDVGTITVVPGRQLAGIVTSGGNPVAGATVYAGRQVMGGGANNDAPLGGFGGLGASTKTDTTDASGAFSLAGFGGGDLAVIADLPGVGRSTPMLVGEGAANQTSLVLELQPYGSISGMLRQGGQPAGGIAVTAQSTQTAGALYIVTAGADGAYRFDRLAPDTYKVSATLGTPRRGLHQYSQQIAVPPGKEVTVDLVVDQGTVTLAATPTTPKPLGGVISYLASAPIAAATAQELTAKLAAAGPGTSQLQIARPGAPATFTEVTPGSYSLCMVPLPVEIRGGQGIGYLDKYASKLPAFCKPVDIAATPATQAVQLAVEVPPLLGGAGSGGP